MPHAGICAGGPGKPGSLPRPRGLGIIQGCLDRPSHGSSVLRAVCIAPLAHGDQDRDGTELHWTAIDHADYYDVVKGDLLQLIDSHGDFTTVTDDCPANDHAGTSFDYPDVPASGEGYWMLVRAEAIPGGCTTYNAISESQAGDRDDEIRAAVENCPCGAGEP